MAQRTSNGRALHQAYVASTALVGISIRTAERPTVLHLAASASLIRERIARLLALAIETPASLLARLNPLRSARVRKVRPAARVGRRRWREAVLAAAALIGGASAATAQTVDRNWRNGGTSDWNLATNWTQNDAADTAGERAVFGGANNRSPFFSQNTTVGGILFSTGGSAYFISNNGNAVTFTGNIVTNSGQQLIYSNTGGVDVAFSATVGNNITLISSANPTANAAGTAGGGFRFDTGGQAGQASISFEDGGPLTVNTGASTTLNVGSLAGSGSVQFQQANQVLSVGALNATTTYSGVIGTGAGAATAALTKVGTGTFILTGANAYGGATTISGGTLQIGNGGATGSLAAGSAITDNSALILNRSGTLAFGNAVSGTGSLTVRGATATGDLITLSGALTQTGGFTVADASNVTISTAGSYTGGRQIELNGGAFTNLGAVDTRSSAFGGTVEGIRINASGTVTNGAANATNATIQARQSGITSVGSATTTVNNYGLVVGRDFAGVGSLSAQSAITINNLNGTGAAAGTGGVIYGQGSVNSGWGAFNNFGSGLTVTNQSAAKIVGTIYGVYGTGAATSVTNAGAIASGTYNTVTGAITVGGTAGIQLDAGGAVLNQAGGTIRGGGDRGITSNAGLTLTNLGTISGTNDGVGVLGGTSNVLNAGTISSSTNSGVAVGGTGATLNVVNAAGGMLSGGSSTTFGYGLQTNGRALTVDNYGMLTSTRTDGAGRSYGLVSISNGAVTANLYAGSTTGNIALSGGNDTVSLYTGTVNATALTRAYTDPVTNAQSTVTLQNAGTVAAASFGTIALGTGTNTLSLRGTGDGTAANGAVGALNMSNVSGLTTLTKQDAGTFVLTGSYGSALTTNVLAGRVIAQDTGNAFGSSGTVAISSGATVELNSTVALNNTGTNYIAQAGNTFTGAGTIAKTGIGEVDFGANGGTVTIALDQGGLIDVQGGILKGSNNNQGNWTNNKGSLSIASGATFDGVEGTIFVDRLTGAGTLQGGYLNGTRTTTVGVANGTDTFSGVIQDATGPLALTKAGTGTQTLTGTNTYTGLTTISAGTLVAANASALGSTAGGTTVANGGNLTIANVAIGAEAVTLNGGSALTGTGTASLAGTVSLNATSTVTTAAVGDALTLSGVISGAGNGLTKAGAGTLTLTGANTYTGATTINAGTLAVTGGAAIADAGTVTLTAGGGGTFAVQASETIGALNGGAAVSNAGAGTVAITAGQTLTTGGGNATGSYAGAINANGTGIVAKTGTGTQTLSGAMTGGGLSVGGGTLALAQGGTLNTAGVRLPGNYVSAASVGAGATFNNAGTITVNDGGNNGLSTNGVTVAGGTFVNSGTVAGSRYQGVIVTGGGTVTNTGSISGGNGVLSIDPGALTVTGGGSITGTNGYGIDASRVGANAVVLGTSAAALGPVSGISGGIIAQTSGAGTIGIVTGGNVTGNAGTGINATTAGTGTVTVSAGAITTTNGSGIVATGTTGAVAVTANGAITAGSTGAATNAGLFLTGNSASNTATVAANTTVQGAIGLRVAGTGTTALANSGTIASTAAAGANTNAVQIDGGTLVIGNTAGTLTGNIAVVNAAAGGGNGPSVLSLTNTNAITLANTVTGAGTLNQTGSGTTILNGVNSAANGQFTGTANVNAGILAVNGTLGNTAAVGAVAANSAVVNVNTGGTLHGSGTIAGSVVVNGGTVSAGNSPGTLTVAGNYTLNAASTSLYELGAPGFVGGASNDLINVGGNLALAGTLNLVAASNAATNPVSGAYRLYNYNQNNAGGTVTGTFGTVTTPTAGTSALVYTNIPNQVNVLLTNGTQSVQYFDGADTTGATAGPQGGTGTWNATTTNWTTLPGGQVNDVWRSGVGIFGTTAGTVTVAGAQNLQGLQFTVDGYRLAGTGTLNLTGDPFTTRNQSFVNVDTNVGATIANALTSTGGAIGLVKLGAGTLTLSGASSYTGATTVQAGTLVIAGGGSITSNVSNNASFTNAGTVTGNLSNAGTAGNTGTITGTAANSGTLTNAGTVGGGLTNLAGTTTNTGTINGGAAILAGTFTTTGIVNGTLSNAATVNAQGQINGAVTNNAGASFVQTGALTGIGRLTNDGAVDLGGNGLSVGSLAGSTAAATISNGGTLSAGSDGTSSAYAGQITGATALTKVGAGTLTLSGTNGYTGATAINAGTLQAGAVNAFSATSAVTIAPGARMDLATFNQTIASLSGAGSVTLGSGTLTTGGSNASTTYAGTISGSGGVVKLGSGTFTLSGANSYTGTTTVQAGTLANTGSLAGPVANAATFTNAGSVAGALTNAGNATNTGSLNGGVANSGTLATSGTIAGGLTNTGTVTASAGRIDGAIANNAGTFTVTGNVASNGTFGNAGGATLAVAGSGAYAVAGLLTNAGSLTVANGGSLTAPAGIVNSGSIQVAQGGTITDALANSGSVVNDGAYNADVSNAASGTIANRTTGVWTGNLTANAGSVTNAGSWQGNARNDAGGTLTNTGTWSTASAPLSNAGTFGNAGTLNGGLANSAGTTTNTGTINGAVAVTGGSLATSGTINGAVSNAAAVTASGQLNGTVANAAGASFVLAGPLTGVTGLTNNGTVDLGGTAFTVGSLSGSNGGAILRNGALTTNGDGSSTAYAGTIVDGGSATSLTKLGAGTLTLTGTNTYSGGTTVAAGTLVASAASLGSGPVTSNTALVIDQAGDATLGSALNGTGRFTKQGAGTLTYAGTGTLSGPTLVATGGLVVNGSLANTVVTVANGAVAGGTGRIGGLVVQSGAGVAPGATLAAGSLGTLGVAGNVLFAAQSLYRVDATAAGQSDRIASTGTATLQGGTVQVTAGTGAYAPSTRYTILTAAGGVAGRFAGATSNFAFLTPFLAYDANDVYLRLARNDLAFGATAQTGNQAGVAAAAQALGVGTPIYDAIAVLSAAQSRQAFNALSGEVYASAVTTMFEGASFVRETILDHLRFGESNGFAGAGSVGQRFAPGSTLPGTYTADLPGRAPTLSAVPTQFVVPAYAVWGQAFGAFGNTAGNGNAAGLSRQTSGFVLGAETALSGLTGAGADLSAWRVGVAGGYSFTGFDVTGRLSSGTVESGYGAVYARGPVGPLQLRLGAAYADNGLTARRTAAFPGFSQSLSGKAGGETIQGFGEVGYRIGTATGYVEPFAGGAAIHIRRDGLTEQGGIAALTVAGRGYDIQTATAGIQGQLVLGDAFGERPLVARGLIGYRRAFGDVVPSALLSFGAGGPSFIASGVPIDRDALVTSAGLDWQVTSAATIGLNYTGQVGPRAQDHGVKGNFNVRF